MHAHITVVIRKQSVQQIFLTIRTELKRTRKLDFCVLHLNNGNRTTIPHLFEILSSVHFCRQSVQNYMRRRRNADRSGKGLRHFSMKVCKKVEEKGKTTYNEVADELVEEVCVPIARINRTNRQPKLNIFHFFFFFRQEAKGQPLDASNYDQKNIRRRVYDALNVLMAMNIISKDKKEIRWIGLPTNSAQVCTSKSFHRSN